MGNAIRYLVGISCWIALTPCNIDLFPFSFPQASPSLIHLANLCAFSASFLLLSLRRATHANPRPFALPALAAGALGMFLACGIACEGLDAPAPMAYLAAVLLGLSSSCGYCQWVSLLSRFSEERSRQLLAIGSVPSIALMPFLSNLEMADQPFTAVLQGLYLLGYLMLFVCTRDMRRDETASVHDFTVSEGRKKAPWIPKTALRAMLPAMVCAMALVLITPLGSAAFKVWIGPIPVEGAIAPAAHLCGLGIIILAWFALKRSPTLPQIYGVTLPLVGSLLLFCTLVSPDCLWIVLFIGEMSFFMTSILMVSTSIGLASRFRCSVVAVYGLFAACVYFSRIVQLLLDYAVRTGRLDGMYYLVILTLLYALMVPAFSLVSAAVMGRGKRTESASPAEPSAKDDPIATACETIAADKQLSPRQAELLEYLARGRSASYIAQALFLSPNTVKSYRKTLYASLDIHSKQQLIDLVEATIETQQR